MQSVKKHLGFGDAAESVRLVSQVVSGRITFKRITTERDGHVLLTLRREGVKKH